MSIVFKHINLNAKDWKKLSAYYQKVFGCVPMPPKRELYGEWFEKLTNIPGARVEGEHIALPGYKDMGPTMEIFTYNIPTGESSSINGYGYAHIAFEVDNLEEVSKRVKKEGGTMVGEYVEKFYETIGKTAKILYTKDPEGNIVELVNWS